MLRLAVLLLLASGFAAQADRTPVAQTPAPWKIAGLTCGFRPFAPMGCRNGEAVCVCDESGLNCRWIWLGCN